MSIEVDLMKVRCFWDCMVFGQDMFDIVTLALLMLLDNDCIVLLQVNPHIHARERDK